MTEANSIIADTTKAYERYEVKLFEVGERERRLREAALWLLNVCYGVGKAGDKPESDEYEMACKQLEHALREAGGA